MRLNGRRKSNNVEDRRHISGKAVGVGGGIVGVIVAAVMILLSGGNIGDVLTNLMSQGGLGGVTGGGQTEYVEDAEDARLADLTSKVLAGTEDVWAKVFREQGWGEYQAPKLVLFHGAVQSACGNATAQTGPFYCSGDQTVYIDLDSSRPRDRASAEAEISPMPM